ncbi:MAG TPA: cysteine--tRNA ligase [Gemmatimonadales bacterium]|nr:cysteine--tRNA ligase [Gemmatimonadales bacterium]
MTLRLYNTLTRQVEPFQPLHPPRVTMYTCGPTVWNYAHIGNFRTFLFEDLLRRHLEATGHDVFQVMNLTDVDDRTIQAAARAGVSLVAHTEPFVQAFFQDRDYLRIKPAHVYPRATSYVAPMIHLVQDLLARGLAYRGEDGVYFSIERFASYGRLSRVERRELKAGARVASDEYAKEDARDFALWKFAQPTDEQVGAAWEAPFGRGRPGWHLECSAMALKEIARFGVRTLDIHAGGVDLIFPHHENEIAQSEGVTGQAFARYWLHGEFLTMAGTKMSKRFGNVLTVRDLQEERVDAGAFRMLVFSTHYRQQLNFTDEALHAAMEGTRRLAELRARLVQAARQDGEGPRDPADPAGGAGLPPEVGGFPSAFRAALDDDLDAPAALAGLFTLVRWANRELDAGRLGARFAGEAVSVLDDAMAVLDLLPAKAATDQALAAWVEGRIAERQAARKARDFPRADAIRAEVAARGIELEDTSAGTRWRVREAAAGPQVQ